MSAHARIVLLVLGVLVLPLGFFFTVKHSKTLLELVELHAELATDGDKATEAVDVVLVFFVDLLVDLECLVEKVHASVTACNHELPFDLLGLDLRSALEILNSLLEHILLGVVHAEARDHIDLRRVVPVALLVKVDSLELVLLLLVEVTHLCKDLRITRHLRDKDVVPLEGFTSHSDQLINVGDLVKHLVGVGDDGVELLEGLQRLVVVAKALVNQTKVVDGLDAVSLDTNGLKEELLCAVELLVHEERVTLVDEGFRVVTIVLDSEISEVLGVLKIVLEEVKERDVVGGHSHHDLIFLLEALKALDSLLNFLVLDEMDGLGDLHLRLDLGKVSSL